MLICRPVRSTFVAPPRARLSGHARPSPSPAADAPGTRGPAWGRSRDHGGTAAAARGVQDRSGTQGCLYRSWHRSTRSAARGNRGGPAAGRPDLRQPGAGNDGPQPGLGVFQARQEVVVARCRHHRRPGADPAWQPRPAGQSGDGSQGCPRLPDRQGPGASRRGPRRHDGAAGAGSDGDQGVPRLGSAVRRASDRRRADLRRHGGQPGVKIGISGAVPVLECEANQMLIAASRIIPATGAADGAAPVLAPGYLTWEAGVITGAGAGPPPGRPDLELTGGFLLPGLVDLQVNGYFGVELTDADPDGWAEVVRRLPETGTTAFLPTFITSPVEQTITSLRRTAGFVPSLAGAGRPGSRLGALGTPGAPGAVGQALADPRLVSGLIADLPPVAGGVAAMASRAAPGRICLVTDAVACAGMPQGRYILGGEPIDFAGSEAAPPVRADGTFAGSVLRMDSAVANMVAAGVGLPDAVAAATRIPADLIARPDLGRIARGAAADLAWLSDDLSTGATR